MGGKDLAGGADQAVATLVQKASPVDEDTTGPGFDSAYQGKQTAFKGVLGLLNVIKADFERTVKVTTKNEAEAHADFTLFDRASTAEISGDEKQQDLQTEEV